MKKIILIALSLFVAVGAMAYVSPPDKIDKNPVSVVISQDYDVIQSTVSYENQDVELTQFVFEASRPVIEIEKIEVGYIEVMPMEVYHRRWQPGNHKFYTAFKINSKGSPIDKVGYRSAQIDRRFSDKRSY